MKTTRFARAAALTVMALFAGGCSQSATMARVGGVEHAAAYDEVLVDRDPHATLAWNAATRALPQPIRFQK